MEQLTYSAADISQLLGVSISAAYNLYHREDFPTLNIGTRMYVLNDKVHQWLIVSKVTFSQDKLDAFDNSEIKILKAQGHVCPRCWNYTQSDNEDGLCDRCKEVMAHWH